MSGDPGGGGGLFCCRATAPRVFFGGEGLHNPAPWTAPWTTPRVCYGCATAFDMCAPWAALRIVSHTWPWIAPWAVPQIVVTFSALFW